MRFRSSPVPWYIVQSMPQGIFALSIFLVIYTLFLWLLQATAGAPQEDVLQYVDPLIGTTNGGHVFPGATLPFGMAKAVADVHGENQGGFASDDSKITGFSHMHDSGTGGAASLGNFPLFPYVACNGDQVDGCDFVKSTRAESYIPGSVNAHPGYFSVTLASNITVEMTVANHTALYRFKFPSAAVQIGQKLSPLILAELTDLSNSAVMGHVSVDSTTGRIMGNATFRPSFGSGNYGLNFCADFSGSSVRDAGVLVESKAISFPQVSSTKYGSGGAWVRFQELAPNGTLTVRVGLSFMNTYQACRNAEVELPLFDFDSAHDRARKAWAEKLSVVQIKPGKGTNDDLQIVFWSGIYRTMISPQDYTGENPLWNSTEPYYDSFYCIWDSFRSIHPLLTLLDPVSQSRMVRSLIDIYVHEGWLPDCRMSLCKGFTQGGSNADVVLVDSYLKNISGPNWLTAYQAIVKDAEQEPRSWRVEGRGNLESWKTLGYIPKIDPNVKGDGLRTRSISRTVEYAYNDFCIAQMAKKLGHNADEKIYFQRSRNWLNLFNPQQKYSVNGTETNFVGFLQPKLHNGTWDYQAPDLCSPLNNFDGCYLSVGGHETYEGSCWLYSFFVPGDMASLIQILGGPTKFIERLDFLHESGLLYMGDEQAFLTVFLYHYAGRPGLSAFRAHTYFPSQFNTTIAGIPGNDDSGAMGSFAALTMMGIFPNAGQNVYFITPPFFESVSITSKQTGNVATIKNINFDSSYEAIYIQSAKLNGKPYSKNWIDHSFFLDGGLLELKLGKTEGNWGTAKEDLPPSLSVM